MIAIIIDIMMINVVVAAVAAVDILMIMITTMTLMIVMIIMMTTTTTTFEGAFRGRGRRHNVLTVPKHSSFNTHALVASEQ